MIYKRLADKDPHAWLRTCKACGHLDEYRNVDSYKGDSWMSVKCKRCRSEDLDRGTMNEYCDDDEDL